MNILNAKSISEMHKILGLESPKHPLITFFYWNDISVPKQSDSNMQVSFDFYMISQKSLKSGAVKYGRNHYDFREGVLRFMAPGQVLGSDSDEETEADGWALFFHPDLIRKTALARKMSEYTFFSYDVHEALHLSEDEKKIITGIAHQINGEYSKNIDIYTQDHIHYTLLDRAKTLLLGTSQSVSEIAYSLGFEYPQYFSKLFKKKTGMTPVEFRTN